MEEIGTLLVEGGEIGANGAEGFEAIRGAEAAGDLLLDLGHTHVVFGGIVGEGDVVIGHETPDIVGMSSQSVDEIERLVLLGAAALAGGRSARIDGGALDKNGLVGASVVCAALSAAPATSWQAPTNRSIRRLAQAWFISSKTSVSSRR